MGASQNKRRPKASGYKQRRTKTNTKPDKETDAEAYADTDTEAGTETSASTHAETNDFLTNQHVQSYGSGPHMVSRGSPRGPADTTPQSSQLASCGHPR